MLNELFGILLRKAYLGLSIVAGVQDFVVLRERIAHRALRWFCSFRFTSRCIARVDRQGTLVKEEREREIKRDRICVKFSQS